MAAGVIDLLTHLEASVRERVEEARIDTLRAGAVHLDDPDFEQTLGAVPRTREQRRAIEAEFVASVYAAARRYRLQLAGELPVPRRCSQHSLRLLERVEAAQRDLGRPAAT